MRKGQAKIRHRSEAGVKLLNANDRDQALEYAEAVKVPFCVVTNGEQIQCFNTSTSKPIRWDGKLSAKVPSKDQLERVLAA